jgi:hypothetical protein
VWLAFRRYNLLGLARSSWVAALCFGLNASAGCYRQIVFQDRMLSIYNPGCIVELDLLYSVDPRLWERVLLPLKHIEKPINPSTEISHLATQGQLPAFESICSQVVSELGIFDLGKSSLDIGLSRVHDLEEAW